jgi:hypothetical protein
MKYFFLLFLVFFSLFANESSSLKPFYSFGSINLHHLTWSKQTKKSTTHSDFTYLEAEGGAGWSWGEVYFLGAIENPSKSYDKEFGDNRRYTLKPVVNLTIKDGFSVHLQDFHFKSRDFDIDNVYAGLGYKYATDGFWIKTFATLHYQKSSYYSGMNGYAAGWVAKYDFALLGESLTLFNWHEMEFARDKEDYSLPDGTLVGNGGADGVNGALALWWNIDKNYTLAMQYRYAKHKLGFAPTQEGLIATLKIFFF